MIAFLACIVLAFPLAALLLWAYERLNEETEIDRWWAEVRARRAATEPAEHNESNT